MEAKQFDERRAHFNDNPVSSVRSFSSPSPSSTASSLPSPGPSTPPPLPDVAFSSPIQSPHAPISSFPSPPHPRVYTPSPIPQAHALPYIPPAPLTPRVYLHTVLAAPSLQYDMRYHPNYSNLQLSPAALMEPASSPPLRSLPIRVAGLPWNCTVRPDPKQSPGGMVTVQDVLICLYYHLRTQVKADEYNAMGKSRKTEICQSFERRVGSDPAQRGKGLRRVDFLGGYVIAQGLARAQSKDEVWDVVIR